MINKQTLDEWLQEYLSNDEDFLMSNTSEQEETFKVYRTILSAVGKTIEYDNVYPLLVASNAMSIMFEICEPVDQDTDREVHTTDREHQREDV